MQNRQMENNYISIQTKQIFKESFLYKNLSHYYIQLFYYNNFING